MKKYLTSFPSLCAQWDYDKNHPLVPESFTHKSGKKVWWTCPVDSRHSFDATICNRVIGRGCPYCSGKKVHETNCLATVNPELAKEWHKTKNGSSTPNDITSGSNRKAWWCCTKSSDHVWEAVVHSRALNGRGCPYCSGHRVSADKNLVVNFPEIAKEWDYEKNDGLRPEEVAPYSGKGVWWICPKNKNHSYQARVGHRTDKKKSGCPYCVGVKVNHTNSLETLFPKIAKQWHPHKNGNLTPADVSIGSDTKVWWQCERSTDHVWLTSVGDRTRGTNCPKCAPQTSLNEIRIFTEIETLFPSARQGLKIYGWDADIFIKELNLVIEYDGSYWHSSDKKRESDHQKNLTFSQNHVVLFRIREEPLPKMSDFDLILPDRPVSKNNLNEIVNTIVELCSLEDNRFDDYQLMENFAGDQRYKEIVYYLPGPAPEQSLATLRPEIAADFHPTKNAPLTPWHFFPGGGQKVWWLCPKDNSHEWQTTPNSRTYGGYGCPICSGMRASSTNNLAVLYPELIQEWHPEKNKMYDPYNIKPGSSYKVWWRCNSNRKHEWQARISARAKGKQKCPICNPFFRSDDNNFAVKFPELALDWHPSKNGKLTPSQLTPMSHEKVWWLCKDNNDHDWKATVASRAGLGTGCPICNGGLCEKNESLLKLAPQIALEWHPQKNVDLPVDRVKPTSARSVWWLCKNNNGHVWKEVIAKRVRGSGCRICAKDERSV